MGEFVARDVGGLRAKGSDLECPPQRSLGFERNAKEKQLCPFGDASCLGTAGRISSVDVIYLFQGGS